MPREIERKFEKEYMRKGYTKKEADIIFYKWYNKHKDAIDKQKRKV